MCESHKKIREKEDLKIKIVCFLLRENSWDWILEGKNIEI